MGHLCYIANHTRKIKIGSAKHRELLFANYGDILFHLLTSSDHYINKSDLDWSHEDIEVICDSDMPRWEEFYDYEDKTEYYYNMYKDSIGDNI
jgi:hypothetical protein